MSAARWRHSKPPPIFDHFRRTATCFSFFCAWANTGKLSQTLCLFSILLPLWSSWKEYNDQTHHKNIGKPKCSVRIFSSPFNFPFAVLSQVKKNRRHSAAAEKTPNYIEKNSNTNNKIRKTIANRNVPYNCEKRLHNVRRWKVRAICERFFQQTVWIFKDPPCGCTTGRYSLCICVCVRGSSAIINGVICAPWRPCHEHSQTSAS